MDKPSVTDDSSDYINYALITNLDSIPLRTRGAPRPRRGPVSGAITDLSALVTSLRRGYGGGLGLTFLVHDWGSEESGLFTENLELLLEEKDSLWIVPTTQRRVSSLHAPRRGVELDLTTSRGSQLYRNLPATLVYFTGHEDNLDQLETWKGRTKVVVIDDSGSASSQLAHRSIDLEIVSYEIDSRGNLTEL